MSTSWPENQFKAGVLALLAAICTLAYFNTASNEFVWDDVSSVLLHRHVQDPERGDSPSQAHELIYTETIRNARHIIAAN